MKRVSGSRDDQGHLAAIGASIRSRREIIGLSQEDLAHLAQIDRSHMGKIERGERNLTLLNLIKVARALECSASELLLDARL